MIGRLDQMMQFNEAALSLREKRQQVLASNIANADTPNYKARDIDFSKALQGAMQRGGMAMAGTSGTSGDAPALAKTAANHLSAGGVGLNGLSAPPMYRTPLQGSIDGNTVEMDTERNQFAENAIRYEAGLTFIGNQIKGMLAAVQG